MKTATLRELDTMKNVEAVIEDETTVSIDAMEYRAFKAQSVEQPYMVAVANRKGARYDFGGIVNGRAYFTK